MEEQRDREEEELRAFKRDLRMAQEAHRGKREGLEEQAMSLEKEYKHKISEIKEGLEDLGEEKEEMEKKEAQLRSDI